jgi:ATP-dependent exoDNAse (exonuclease V) beta subunit
MPHHEPIAHRVFPCSGRRHIPKALKVLATGSFIILALEREHSIELASSDGGSERAITGHIDFLQVRNGAVHIPDYKPDARTNKPIAQLSIYALALTRRAPGLKLFDIKCAWFNEEEYCEMFPRTLFSQV